MILHVVVVAFFTVRAVFFTPESIRFDSAVRVDMVALPDKAMPDKLAPLGPDKPDDNKNEPAKPEPKPEPKAHSKPELKTPPKQAAKPEPKPVEKAPKTKDVKDPEAINLAKEKKQKAALEKLKAMSALDEIRAEEEKESKKAAAAAAAAKPSGATAKVKGNILSPGTELTGISKLQHDNYLATLDQQIKRNWVLPQWLAKKPLRAQVRIRLNDKGEVIRREIALSSGNSSYDDLALDTIDRSAPFPPPPEKFVQILEVTGLLVGFPE